MGLKNRNKNINYLKIKDGKFYVGKDEESPYDEFEGQITGIRFKDEEFKGNEFRKIILSMSDETDNYELGINTNNSAYGNLISFLANVDLSRKITLHPKFEMVKNKVGEDTPRRSILVSQDGKFAKAYFTKDDKHGLPEWKTVTVGKVKVTDKDEYLAFLENFVNEKFIPQLGEAPEKQAIVTEEDESDNSVSETATGRSAWDDEQD